MFSLAQYHAVRHAAGLVDRSTRGKIAVRGQDRASYLQGLLTNDIQALESGRGCYAALLTPQGRMIADVRVSELGDAIVLDLPAAVTRAVLDKLDQSVFTEDVQLEDLTDAWAQLAVHGPGAAVAIASGLHGASRDREAAVSPAHLASFGEYHNTRTAFRGEPLVIVRTDDLGEPGFDLSIAGPHAAALHETLRMAGAIEVGPETAEVLRVEAGRPAFGVDMDDTTIPLEAGIETRALSFTKGCYVGQEVIVRVLHRGHGRVARKLVGVVLDGDRVPAAGDSLEGDGKEIGHVTSAVLSPTLGRPIALGYVRREFSEPGSVVTVACGGRPVRAVVRALPFVTPRS